jgi:hypothetical protein
MFKNIVSSYQFYLNSNFNFCPFNVQFSQKNNWHNLNKIDSTSSNELRIKGSCCF